MATAVIVTVVALRFLVPLFIPRFPLPAILVALVIDAVDQTIFQAVTDDPLPGYQAYDKALDVYYLTIAYCATMRNWRDPVAFGVARFLFLYRLVGVVLFETTHQRWLLLVFPNTFEYFFIAYEVVATRWDPRRLRAAAVVSMALAIWVFVKLPQEFWIHVAQLDVTDFVSANPWVWFVVAGAVTAVSVVLIPQRNRLPRADHPFSLAAEPRLPPLPIGRRRFSLRDGVLWEKAILLALICVIFANILPGIEAGPVGIAFGAALMVVLNAVVSEWWYRRGRTWQNATRAFLAMLVINLAILLADSLFGPERDDVPTAANLGFVVLLALLIALFDRMRATRGPGDRRLPASAAFELWRRKRAARQEPVRLPMPPG
ncbi:MAG TPA: hypothetical protein VNQ73_19565 [Ilumatobacter sp.]|nr:hypothetical protein [Ilumatobacter sp.]